jgi:hypothetical protein
VARRRRYLDASAEERAGRAERLDRLASAAEACALPDGCVPVRDLLHYLCAPRHVRSLVGSKWAAILPPDLPTTCQLGRPLRCRAYPPTWAVALRAEASRLRVSLIGCAREGGRTPTDVTPAEVRALLHRAGYTQAQCAAALGVGAGAVSAWVRGCRLPPDWALRHLRWLARQRQEGG